MKKKNNFKSVLQIGLVLICVFALITVPLANSAWAYEPSKAPKINAFTVSKASINKGDSVVLSWDVINASKISIKGLRNSEEELKLKDSMEVWPEVSTTYVLTAYGDGGESSKSVAVNVGVTGSVKIDSFTVSATDIVNGDSIKVSWKTTNATKVSLVGMRTEESEVESAGTTELWPEVTTTYVLRAYGVNGEMDSKSVTVNVNEPVKPATINSFTASVAKIDQGQSATLKWDVSNSKSVDIKDIKTGLNEKGLLTVTPNSDTTYTLVVVGKDNKSVTKTVTIAVVQKVKSPVINTFTASSVSINSGDLVTLKWTTTDADKCELLASDGGKITNRPANGSISVTPFETKTYTLIAYSADQKIKVEKSIKITVK